MMERKLRNDWFLIEAWPGLMLTAKVEIVAREVEFFLPMTWFRAKVDGVSQPHAVPRLPGNYAFISLPNDPYNDDVVNEQAAAIAGLRGVRQVYKNARGSYSAVQRWEIQALKDAEAFEHREAGKAQPKVAPSRFKAGTKVRVVRHAMMEGHIGEFLYAVKGQATVAMENGIKLAIPECDIADIAQSMSRRAG